MHTKPNNLGPWSSCGERILDVVKPQGRRCFTDGSIVGSLLVFWVGFLAKKSRVHWLAFQARFSSPLVYLLATVKPPLTIGCSSSSLWIHPLKPLEIEMRERWGTGRKTASKSGTSILQMDDHQQWWYTDPSMIERQLSNFSLIFNTNAKWVKFLIWSEGG